MPLPWRCMAPLLSFLWTGFDHLFPLNFIVYFVCWPFLEVAFYFRLRRYCRLRSRQALQHHPSDTKSVLETFWPMVLEEDPSEEIIEGWFVGEGELRTGNVEELIGWTLFAKSVRQLDAEQKATSDALLARVLAKAEPSRPWAPGYNPSRRCLLHTLEPLEDCWKPLIFYMLLQAARDAAWWLLRRRGFELRSHGACRYWYHPGRDGAAVGGTAAAPAALTPAPAPLVVLHGVGGLVPYVALMLKLRRDRPRHPLLAPLLTHCSILPPPFEPPPPLDTTRLVAGLADAIESLPRRVHPEAPRRCHFFGHSLGTAVLASVARSRPDLVASATFVDPVCFLIYRSNVVYNFLYRSPTPLRHGVRQARHFGYWFRLALHYVLKREPTIQSCFRREFWWGRHWLHPAHLECPAHVILSGRDAIVPSHLVHDYLLAFKRKTEPPQSPQSSLGEDGAQPRLGVELHERWHHGLAVMAPFAMRRVLAPLYKLVDQAEATLTREREMTGVTPTAEEAGLGRAHPLDDAVAHGLEPRRLPAAPACRRNLIPTQPS